ncbi:MAG: STAS domain-containing protein [Planctomycetales bacterium]
MESNPTRPLEPTGPVFNREWHGGAIVLSPHASLGDLNENQIKDETAQLLELINHSGPVLFVIDLQTGDYFGSAFLGAIVRIWKRVAQRGGRLALCHVSENIIQILRVTKLHTTWPIYATRAEALRGIGA